MRSGAACALTTGSTRCRSRRSTRRSSRPDGRACIDFGNRQPDLRDGLHFNLHNNLWGTDFPQWYEDDALFRFSLRLTR